MPPLNLLLLLHLLQIDECRSVFRGLLCTLHQHAPVVGDGKLSVQCRRKLAGLYMDGNIKFAVGRASEDAVSWRDIGIVTPNSCANVTMMRDEVVSGVEAYPAKVRQQDVDPRVGCIGRRTVVVFAAAVKIAGYVPGRNPNVS